MDSSVAVELQCRCSECKTPAGISTKLISWQVVQGVLATAEGKGKTEEEVIEEMNERLQQGEEFPSFVPFSFTFDSVTKVLWFPMWCPKCEKVVSVAFCIKATRALTEGTVVERTN